MIETVSIPKYFRKDRVFDLVKADDLSYVEYRQYDERGKNELFITSYMFVYIINGKKIIHTDAKSIEVGKGNAFFAKKGAYIVSERVSSETGVFESLIFFFEDRFLLNFIKEHVRKKDVGTQTVSQSGIFPVRMSPFLKLNIESVLPHFAKTTPNAKNLLNLKFQEVLLNLLDSDVNNEFHAFMQSIGQEKKKDLADIVESNLTKQLNIEELAKLSGRSLTSFKREFTQTFGMPPRIWINRRRVERAYTILSTSDRSVTDVCFEIGFSNLSYFIQLFKNCYGITPKKLQKDREQQK